MRKNLLQTITSKFCVFSKVRSPFHLSALPTKNITVSWLTLKLRESKAGDWCVSRGSSTKLKVTRLIPELKTIFRLTGYTFLCVHVCFWAITCCAEGDVSSPRQQCFAWRAVHNSVQCKTPAGHWTLTSVTRRTICALAPYLRDKCWHFLSLWDTSKAFIDFQGMAILMLNFFSFVCCFKLKHNDALTDWHVWVKKALFCQLSLFSMAHALSQLTVKIEH